MITYSGERVGDFNISDLNIFSATRILVYFINAGETPKEIFAQPEIPGLNAPYMGLINVTRTNMSIAKLEGGDRGTWTYEVTVNYAQKIGSGGSSDTGNSSGGVKPWDMPISHFSLVPVDNIVAMEKAYDDENKLTVPVVASSGTPIAINQNKPNLLLSFSYNVKEFKDAWILKYYNTINQNSITIAGVVLLPKRGLFRQIKHQLIRVLNNDGTEDYNYYNVSIEIEIKKTIWSKEVADMSLYMLNTDATMMRVYESSSSKYGNNGYGTLKQLKSSINSDGTITDEEKIELLNEIQPTSTEMALDLSGGLSFENGQFRLEYLKFNNKYQEIWNTLNLPKTRF